MSETSAAELAPPVRARPRDRRTQEERTASTRRALIDATLDLLAESGYARTTTGEIAKRAGVSRGALMHHFVSKEELVTVSVEHLLAQATALIRNWLERVRTGELTFDDFLDRLWEMYSGRLFFITVEHIAEARHNTMLRESMVPVVREFHAALDATWHVFFRDSGRLNTETKTALNMTTSLFRGLGIQTVLRQDDDYYRRQLDSWKAHLKSQFTPPTNARSNP